MKTMIEIDKKITMEVHYGFTKLGNQEPYFSMTRNVSENGELTEAGMVSHNLLEIFAPKLAKYAKWHLCFLNSGPMHYKANAMYWAAKGNINAFKEVVIYGGIEEKPLPLDMEEKALPEWLDERLPRLIKAFHADMVELLGEDFQSQIKG